MHQLRGPASSRYVEANGVRLHYLLWGQPAAKQPAAVLLHGTAFCAATWQSVAESLAANFAVYAFDRRGHGLSDKPEIGYEFRDFGNDLVACIDALGIADGYGIGHSAGGTDVLLAAAARPHAFARVFVMEPTLVDPGATPLDGADVHARAQAMLETLGRRRTVFPSRQAALERYAAAPAFADWKRDLLSAYVDHGFETLPDGQVRLRCAPDIEQRMLKPIAYAMLSAYRGDAIGHPFEVLADIRCPVTVSASARSQSVYHGFVDIATRLIPDARRWLFEDTGHCVPQENPDALVAALRRCWNAT